MTDSEWFAQVGIRPAETEKQKKHRRKGFPLFSAVVLAVIVIGCLFAEVIMTKDPTYLDLMHCNTAPNAEFLFGTDSLGRDIFSGIWYGGRISIAIGFLATLISTAIAMIYGAFSGIAPDWLDAILMRAADILLSIPSLLTVLFLQAILGEASVFSLSVVIGVTGWSGMAKVVRTEVKQLRNSEYVVAARCMGGRFFHVLIHHLAPNFLASILFMVVMNVRSAIVAESTLSFIGMGLPVEIISWGSMLSLSEQALFTGNWWIILIPGAFLIALLAALTSIGNALRKSTSRKSGNL